MLSGMLTRLSLAFLLVAGVAAFCAPKPKRERFQVTAVILSKTEGAYQSLSIRAEDKTVYTCFMNDPDDRFRWFHYGDTVSVDGKKTEGTTVIDHCQVIVWTEWHGEK